MPTIKRRFLCCFAVIKRLLLTFVDCVVDRMAAGAVSTQQKVI